MKFNNKKFGVWNVNNAIPLLFPIYASGQYRPDKKKKIKLKFYFLLPIILFIYFLRFLKINIRKYPDQFGHQSFDIEHFLKLENKKFDLNLFLSSAFIPNKFLFSKHKKLINIIVLPNSLIRKLSMIDSIAFNFFGKSIYNYLGYEFKKINLCKKEWIQQKPFISFTKEEEQKGHYYLKKMNLKKNNYVLFVSRTKNYYIRKNEKFFEYRGILNPKKSIINHENSLAQHYRNSNFKNYLKTINYLSKKNISSVRIGALERPLKLNVENYVDYAGQYRYEFEDDSSFMDFYLMRNCLFMVAGMAGICASYLTFDKPLLLTNCFPWPWLHMPPRSGDFFMPKILKNDRGYIYSFRDMIDFSRKFDWRSIYNNQFFKDNLNLRPIEQSEDEIYEATLEIYNDIKFKKNMTTNERKIRDKFKNLFTDDIHLKYIKSKIPYSYLKKYEDLIG